MKLSGVVVVAALCQLLGADEIRAQGVVASVTRVEPPSWWTAPAAQELTVLIDGSGLKGASVTTARPGVLVRRVECPGNGSTLFVDLSLDSDVLPGAVTLEISNAGTTIKRDWEIRARATHRPAPVGPDDVIYLIMPDRFANGDPANDRSEMGDDMLNRRDRHAYHGGDFAGIRRRLPYLADLGVTALWLTPVYKNGPNWFTPKTRGAPRKYADFHGYSPIDFYDTNPRFGTKDEYSALVDEAHRLGLKVIQDHIVGFTGPRHRWTVEPPAPGWFHGPIERPAACNFRFDALANPHALEADRRGMTDGWFFGILPDLDTRDPRVKRYAIQQSLWWAEMFAADAIRLDTYPMVDRLFWREWSRAQKAQHAEMRAIGEAWVNDADLLSFFQGGRAGWDGVDPGIDTVFDFPLNLAIVDVISNRAPASKLDKALARDFVYPRPELLVTFLGNHDTRRLVSSPNVTPARHRLAAAFLLTARGIPQLTWGDEVNLGGDGDDRKDFPGGWPGDGHDAFSPTGRKPDEQATFETYRKLLRLRKDHAALRRGRMTVLCASNTVFGFVRENEGERVVVILNFGSAPETATLAWPFASGGGFDTLYGDGRVVSFGPDVKVEVPAERAVVLRAR
jgi:glycosidase